MDKKYSQTLITLFILLLNIPAALSIDEHAASLPAMAIFFNTNTANMQLTITLYMLGMSISQWLCGALSDRFGRRPVLLSTAGVFLVATIFCASALSVPELLIGRFFQGAGAGCFAMIPQVLMAEALDKKRVPSVSSYFCMSYALIPIVAPVIGGYLQDFFGWRSNFLLMLIAALGISLFAYFKLPETHTSEDRNRLEWKQLLQNYLLVLRNPEYMTAVISMILAWASVIVFSILGPFLLQNTLSLSAIQFGHYTLLIGLGFFIGNILNNRLIKRLQAEQIIAIGLLFALIISLLQGFLILVAELSVSIVIVPAFLLMITAGLIFPCLYAKAVTVFSEQEGIASALIGCLILLGAVIITAIITLFKAHSALTLPSVYLALNFLCTLLFLRNSRRTRQSF